MINKEARRKLKRIKKEISQLKKQIKKLEFPPYHNDSEPKQKDKDIKTLYFFTDEPPRGKYLPEFFQALCHPSGSCTGQHVS